jgi:hypothetical protein
MLPSITLLTAGFFAVMGVSVYPGKIALCYCIRSRQRDANNTLNGAEVYNGAALERPSVNTSLDGSLFEHDSSDGVTHKEASVEVDVEDPPLVFGLGGSGAAFMLVRDAGGVDYIVDATKGFGGVIHGLGNLVLHSRRREERSRRASRGEMCEVYTFADGVRNKSFQSHSAPVFN